jgi:hypothetical protein
MPVQRSRTGRGLSNAVERLSDNAAAWGTGRVLDEGLDLIRDSTWADVSILHLVDGSGTVQVLARRPGPGDGPGEVPMSAVPDRVPEDWFPWGLAPVSPLRFLLVEDARFLPAAPARPPDHAPTVGELGMCSCLHLPILERSTPVGAVHLYWAEPRLAWDDDHGRLLRTLGRFLLSTAGG